MKKFLAGLSSLFLCHVAPGALVTVGPWTPIFKGVELASGQQQAQTGSEQNHQVLCLRVDLTDPDVVLFTTPHCTNCGGYETLSENTSHFLEQYGVQAAVNGGFYSSSSGPADTPLGTTEDVYGLAISRGVVVSPSDDPAYVATLMFRTNNQAIYIPANSPATNTAGMYTAVAGNRALLLRGTNLNAATPADLDPRTGIGLSQDRRYLLLMTIDGRQTGWSDGADFHDTGEWLKRFGATDGINVDGGGSTTMVTANCVGGAVRLNRSSFVAENGRERNTGHNFGVYAKPLPGNLKGLNVQPGTTTALLTWGTDARATTQVEYGATTNYGSATAYDARLVTKHVSTLAGLTRGSNYYFRAISTWSGQSYTQACQFTTLTALVTNQVFGLTNGWTYATNNLDGVSWKAKGYNDGGWYGQGPGLLYVENATYVSPKNTLLPSGTYPFRTYYFRTHFPFAGSIAGGTLTLSNYVDDGAVFYLNGAELYRLRMSAAPTTIANNTLASGSPCTGAANAGDAGTNCPDVFTVNGDVLTNLVAGDNVLAVEVHNYAAASPDIVFGSALFLATPFQVLPHLYLWLQDDVTTFFWNGEGFTLQQAATLSGPGNWTDLPGPVTQSPFTLTNSSTRFYRLRQ